MIESIILLAVVGTLNIVCFFIGAKIGQKVVKGEEITPPTIVNPIEKHRARRQASAEQDKIDTIMQNIEAYDGTSNGQKEVR